MTDPNTPARGTDQPVSPAAPLFDDGVHEDGSVAAPEAGASDAPVNETGPQDPGVAQPAAPAPAWSARLDPENGAEQAAAEPAPAAEPAAAEERDAEPAVQEAHVPERHEGEEHVADESFGDESFTDEPTATRAFAASDPEPAAQPVVDSDSVSSRDTGVAAGSDPEPRAVPPLSPPSAAAPAPSTGALHDDSALRAAEAARSGESVDPATEALPRANAAETGDLDDTRITQGTPRSTTAWTPPPAPASPSEFAAPATGVTPTPYAPPTEVMPAPAAAPVTSTTPLTNLGKSPAESLGFTEGIAGGDDGFTPEELAQRRQFRDEMAFRQKQEFAGINFGSAFFGWLAAVGLAGILYLIASGIAVAAGLAQSSVIDGSSTTVKSLGSAFDTNTLQVTALVVFLVVLFVSYFVGGFVASRMARFSGLKQGLAVWLWGLVWSIIGAVVVVVIASQNRTGFQDLTGGIKLASFITVDALIAEGLIVVLSLGGALVGGLAGLRYHRRVDRFGLEEV